MTTEIVLRSVLEKLQREVDHLKLDHDLGVIVEALERAASIGNDLRLAAAPDPGGDPALDRAASNGNDLRCLQVAVVELTQKVIKFRQDPESHKGIDRLRRLPVPSYDLLLPFKDGHGCHRLDGGPRTTTSAAAT